MDKENLYKIQKNIGISVDLLIREEYEMIVLKSLFESVLGKKFIFKGGTALRLAYGSKRYSEDLDFNVMGNIKMDELRTLFTNLSIKYKEMTLIEFVKKKNTILALLKIKSEILPYAFSIKFEISTRKNDWKKGIDYELVLLRSEVTNLTVLGQVSTLERIKKDKKAIEPKRVRDIYDLWYIDQKLGTPTQLSYSGYDKKIVKRDINKFIPLQERMVIEKWL